MLKAKLFMAWLWTHRLTVVPVLLAAVVLAAGVAPTFAQASSVPTDTLIIDVEMVTSGIFQGANIMIVVLGAIIFLMAGFKFGVALMQGILRLIGNISIG